MIIVVIPRVAILRLDRDKRLFKGNEKKVIFIQMVGEGIR